MNLTDAKGQAVKGKREIDPEQAEVVRRIFREYAAGVSPRAIAIGLTRDCVTAPDGSKIWKHQTFIGSITGGRTGGMISNRLYVGELVWNSMKQVKNPETGKRTRRPGNPDDLMVIPVAELQIIDRELWDAAQQVRRERAAANGAAQGLQRHVRSTAKPRLLNGLLKCGVCNGHMVAAMQSSDGTPRAVCDAAHRRNTCEHRKSYDMTMLEKVVLDGMRDHLTDPKAVAEATRQFHAEYAARQRKNSTDEGEATRRLNKLTVQIQRLTDAITDSDVPVKELVERLKALETERAGLTERLRLIKAETNVVTLHPTALDAYRVNVEKMHAALTGGGMTGENLAAFRNLIDCVVVHPTKARAPYEVTPYARVGAMLGIEVFPAVRTPAQIIEQEGISKLVNGGPMNSQPARLACSATRG
jgi:hypothetical protein